ncbi:MAG: FG-GAP repeat protein [Planctomycetota bacterium]
MYRLTTTVLAVVIALHSGSVGAAIGDELGFLTPEPLVYGRNFGTDVAMDGGFLAVTAPLELSGRGAVYVYDPVTRQPLYRLTESALPGIDNAVLTGLEVDIDAGRLIVGLGGDWGNGFNSGGAAVYDLSTGARTRLLVSDDGEFNDFFGVGVAIEGSVALVGAPRDDDAGQDAGAVYVFDVNTGAQLDKLYASDPGPGDRFGSAIDVDNGVAIVGARNHRRELQASGAAYVFDVASGSELLKLTTNIELLGAEFGGAVAIDDGVALVGALGAGTTASGMMGQGAAYLFDLSTGAQLEELLPSSPVTRRFGQRVDLDDGVAVVGAPSGGAGFAYLFDVLTGTRIARVQPAEVGFDETFGYAVAVDGGQAAIGALRGGLEDLFGTPTGAVYLFDAGLEQQPGDFNGDGRVDNTDLNLLLVHWGEAVPPRPEGWLGVAPSGPLVDNDELNALLQVWGFGTSVSVPEPVSALLISAAMVFPAICRRAR